LAIILPIISAFFIYIFGKYAEKYVGWIATVAASLSVYMIISMVPDIIKHKPIHDTYAWIRTPSLSLRLGFMVDGLSFCIALVVAVISALSCLYSIKYMENSRGQVGYYANLLFFMA